MSDSLQQSPLIPAQTTLLQPGAQYFRLIDALNRMNDILQQITDANGNITLNQSNITTLQTSTGQIAGEIVTLQNQVTAIRSWINTYGVPALGGAPV